MFTGLEITFLGKSFEVLWIILEKAAEGIRIRSVTNSR